MTRLALGSTVEWRGRVYIIHKINSNGVGEEKSIPVNIKVLNMSVSQNVIINPYILIFHKNSVNDLTTQTKTVLSASAKYPGHARVTFSESYRMPLFQSSEKM